jgi:hypothetical protein
VTVKAAASVTADPANQTVNAGQTATFSVTASSTPSLAYQWQKSTDGGGVWADVTGGSGGDTASYTTPATTAGDDGCQYRCVVTNGCGSDTSQAATLTVQVEIGGTIDISTQSSTSYSFNRTVTLVVKSGTGTTLATVTPSLEFTNSSGAASASYALSGLPAGARSISTKMAGHLRKKAAFAAPSGPVTANLTLRGGDVNGTNSVNILDYAVLKANWFTTNAVADINGDGQVQMLDYNLMRSNWFATGDPE